jgi:hypothetical protein
VVSAARLVLAALVVASCVKVDPPDGAFACGTGGKCPDGYYCASNNTCYQNGHTVDMGACAGGMCTVNQACNQPSDCSTGSCLAGYCQLVSDSPKWISTGVPPLSGPRAEFAAFVSSDQFFIDVSGAVDGNDTVTDTVTGYKIGAGIQKSDAAIPHARYGHSGAIGPDGRFYVTGGCSMPGCPASTTLTLVDAFDYASNSWNSPAAPAALNAARRHAASAYAGGKLWVFGGYDGSKVLGSIEVYNPGSPDSWTTIAAVLPTPRTGLAAVTGGDDRVYTIGGGDSTFTSAPSLEIFDPKTMTLSPGANMSIGRGLMGAVAAPDGRIYAIGGYGQSGPPVATVEAYTPATDTWVPVAQVNVARYGGVALIGADDRIYFMGGEVAGGNDGGTDVSASAIVEVYGPAITVAPGTGTAGATNVSISGSNFAANAVVDVFFGDRGSAPVASGNTDESGSISAPVSFILPANATSGSAKIFAVDRKSQYPAVTTFVVQ